MNSRQTIYFLFLIEFDWMRTKHMILNQKSAT